MQGLLTNVDTSMDNDDHLYHDLQLQNLIPRLHFSTKGNNCIIAETTICVKQCTGYTAGSSSTFLTILFYSLLFQCSINGEAEIKESKGKQNINNINLGEFFFQVAEKMMFYSTTIKIL